MKVIDELASVYNVEPEEMDELLNCDAWFNNDL